MAEAFQFSSTSKDKAEVFAQAARILFSHGFKLIDFDARRPWGFYLSVDETQAPEFIKQFYDGIKLGGVDTNSTLRPKFLGIEPGKRLSWQYHHRRSEVWKTLAGSYGLVTGRSDDEEPPRTIKEGEVIIIPQGIRHRGVGLESWALIAEIWQHTDSKNPSNEDDIVRVQDDFGR